VWAKKRAGGRLLVRAHGRAAQRSCRRPRGAAPRSPFNAPPTPRRRRSDAAGAGRSLPVPAVLNVAAPRGSAPAPARYRSRGALPAQPIPPQGRGNAAQCPARPRGAPRVRVKFRCVGGGKLHSAPVPARDAQLARTGRFPVGQLRGIGLWQSRINRRPVAESRNRRTPD
jgi:hypothetical protein